MTSQFSFLRDNLQITPLDDQHVQVTVTLPSDHVLHFLRILDALSGFAQTVNARTRLHRLKQQDNEEQWKRQAEQAHVDYHRLIVGLFDKYTAQGFNRNEAVKRIGADLRKRKHPWSSPDLVRSSLGPAGRPGCPGRPRRQP